jgi:hypothetical protein
MAQQPDADTWGALAQKMQPSQGAYSGGFGQGGSTLPGGAQWMRRISLIVYGAQPSAPAQSAPAPALDPAHPPPTRALAVIPRADQPPGTTTPLTASPPPVPAAQANPSGLELAALRVTFNLHKNTSTTPNILEARIYNMHPETMSKMTQFTRVQLSAGYKYAQYGMLFDGEVIIYRQGRENQTDTYMEIKAADGQIGDAVSFHRFDPPMKESDALKQLIKDSKIPEGHVSDQVGTEKLQRPWIVAGSTQAYIRQLMLKYDAQCWPDMNKLHIVKQREYLPGEAPVLSPQTGLVGIPEATPAGIQMRCLLNPRLRMGGLVKLDKKYISGIAYIPGTDNAEATISQQHPAVLMGGQQEINVPTSPIGTYKIYMMEISGDTRGVPWYCDLVCLAIDADGQVRITPGSVFTKGF